MGSFWFSLKDAHFSLANFWDRLTIAQTDCGNLATDDWVLRAELWNTYVDDKL